MKSSMRKEYASVPKGANINRSSFNLTETHKTTWDGGELTPIYWKHAYPGEVWKGNVQGFLRASSPLDFPLMDNMKLTVHWYAVPLRIIWTNFRKFFGERSPDPDSNISYTIPVGSSVAIDTTAENLYSRLAVRMGIPYRTVGDGGFDFDIVSMLPFRAYNKVWNWHYRDQNLQDSVADEMGDGPDIQSLYNLMYRGKRHDYFTAMMPAPQKGDAVTIGGEVATDRIAGGAPSVWSTDTENYKRLDSDAAHVDVSATTDTQANALYPNTTINELRNAAAVQRFLESDNRYGTRFDELIYSHYGVEFNDVRIAPVYLGGGSGNIQTSAIPNNSGSSGNLGDLAAIATGGIDGASFTYAVDEPCIIMALANVEADVSYQQGVHREFSYSTRYDLFSPEFVGIGDQAALQQELLYENASTDDDVFGYTPRYEEMRTGVNRVTGEFNSDHPLSLDVWHLAQDFGSTPGLNNTFIKQASPFNRVLQVTTQDNWLGDFKINVKAARALPVNGVPGLSRL